MLRIIRWIALGAVVFSLNSCGLPGALMRTVGNTVNSLGGLARAGAAAAAL